MSRRERKSNKQDEYAYSSGEEDSEYHVERLLSLKQEGYEDTEVVTELGSAKAPAKRNEPMTHRSQEDERQPVLKRTKTFTGLSRESSS